MQAKKLFSKSGKNGGTYGVEFFCMFFGLRFRHALNIINFEVLFFYIIK